MIQNLNIRIFWYNVHRNNYFWAKLSFGSATFLMFQPFLAPQIFATTRYRTGALPKLDSTFQTTDHGTSFFEKIFPPPNSGINVTEIRMRKSWNKNHGEFQKKQYFGESEVRTIYDDDTAIWGEAGQFCAIATGTFFSPKSFAHQQELIEIPKPIRIDQKREAVLASSGSESCWRISFLVRVQFWWSGWKHEMALIFVNPATPVW